LKIAANWTGEKNEATWKEHDRIVLQRRGMLLTDWIGTWDRLGFPNKDECNLWVKF